MSETEQFDVAEVEELVIAPHEPVWNFRWNEVWHYRHLFRFLVYRDLVVTYKQTILGPLHLFIRPFIMTLLFQLVFHQLGRMPTDGISPFLFYFANNTAWAFFIGAFGSVSGVFSSGKGLMSKVYFPRIIPPLASVCTTAVSLLIQLAFLFVLIISFFFLFGTGLPNWRAFFLVLPMLQLAMIAIGGGFLFACVTLRYRDLMSLSSVITQGMMYLSPIIYPIALIPEKFRLLAYCNPISSAIETFRYFLFGEATLNFQFLAIGWSVTLVLFASGVFAFNIRQRKFVDIV